MTTIAYSPVNIQTSARSVPSIPNWFGEITLLAHHLQQQGVLAAIEEQVRFARRRFGRYEVIDFVAVLAGLRRQRRTDAGSLLRVPSTLGRAIHGPVRTRPFASPCDALAFSRRAGSGRRGVLAHPVPQRSPGSSSGEGRAAWWAVRPAREPLPRLRCGWHA